MPYVITLVAPVIVIIDPYYIREVFSVTPIPWLLERANSRPNISPVSGPQYQPLDELYAVQKRKATDFVALNMCQDRSGRCGSSFSMPFKVTVNMKTPIASSSEINDYSQEAKHEIEEEEAGQCLADQGITHGLTCSSYTMVQLYTTLLYMERGHGCLSEQMRVLPNSCMLLKPDISVFRKKKRAR